MAGESWVSCIMHQLKQCGLFKNTITKLKAERFNETGMGMCGREVCAGGDG